MIIALLLVTIVVAGVAIWFYSRRPQRAQSELILGDLGRILTLSESRIQKYPILTLHGSLFSLPLAIECVQKGRKNEARWIFRVLIRLPEPVANDIMLQSGSRHGKVTHHYGKELVVSGDASFDRSCIVMALEKGRLGETFSQYLRSKFTSLADVDYVAEIRDDTCSIDIITSSVSPRRVAAIIHTIVEWCNVVSTISTLR